MAGFNYLPDFRRMLSYKGFNEFFMGHSSCNGFDLMSGKLRIAFYDNKIWGIDKISVKVIDYNKGVPPEAVIYEEEFDNIPTDKEIDNIVSKYAPECLK